MDSQVAVEETQEEKFVQSKMSRSSTFGMRRRTGVAVGAQLLLGKVKCQVGTTNQSGIEDGVATDKTNGMIKRLGVEGRVQLRRR